jgi:hypothetical protein
MPLPDDPTAEAIFRTLLYADVFSFPMTEAELHHFLIGLSASPGDVRLALQRSVWLSDRIERVNGYCCVRGRRDITDERHERDQASLALWPVARRFGAILAHLPFVRMVALTGALSMRNAHNHEDDIDYLLVTVPGRVWTARLFAVLLVRLARFVGVGLCPNYVLAQTALTQSRQDLFTAHELAQMIPLAGRDVYEVMRAANPWASVMLPNAHDPFYEEPDHHPRGLGRAVQWLGEALFVGPLGNAFERWEQRRKLRKFEAEARKPNSSAQLDGQHVKGHFNDYGYPALEDYYARLERYELVDEALGEG